MNRMNNFGFLLLLGVIGLFSANCGNGGGGGSSNPNAGFLMQTFATNPGPTGNPIFPTAGQVNGQFLQASGTTTGTLEGFNLSHGGVGFLPATGAKVPGLWRLTLGPNIPGGGSLCLTFSTVDRSVSLNQLVPLYCPGRYTGFVASPDSIDALNPPTAIVFSGTGIDHAHGAPRLAFYDEFGNIVASTQATQLLTGDAADGIVISTPDLSHVHDGTYSIAIHNVNADGSLDLIGGAIVHIFGNPPPPPPPPGGGGCGEPQPNMPELPCLEY